MMSARYKLRGAENPEAVGLNRDAWRSTTEENSPNRTVDAVAGRVGPDKEARELNVSRQFPTTLAAWRSLSS
jgi:hypothetical protein